MISFVALTIDTLLPAYGEIKVYYDVEDAQLHWIITCLFIGFSFGQIIFGPLSDRLGRQNSIIIGVSIYIVGCIICLTSSSYTFFVIGRLIQGLGIGGPRVVSQAICRDLFSGNKLASINSFIMSIFILVPIVAPLFGQTIMIFLSWKWIIIFFIIFSLATTLMLKIFVKETLIRKIDFNLVTIFRSFETVTKNIKSLLYIISLGTLLGGLLTFINICQPLYQDFFNLGLYFPLFFAGVASMLGLSSFLNSKLVIHLGAVKISLIFTTIFMIWCVLNFLFNFFLIKEELLWFSIFIMASFFFFGLIFGNLNALALDPFGHMAGYASSAIGALSTIIAVTISGLATPVFDGTPTIVIYILSMCSITTFIMLSIAFFKKN